MHDVHMGTDDFYEPDEPLDEVLAAFEQGERRLTAMPAQGRTEHLKVEVPVLTRGWTARLPAIFDLLKPLATQPTSPTSGLVH